jgi:hypothetical protein
MASLLQPDGQQSSRKRPNESLDAEQHGPSKRARSKGRNQKKKQKKQTNTALTVSTASSEPSVAQEKIVRKAAKNNSKYRKLLEKLPEHFRLVSQDDAKAAFSNNTAVMLQYSASVVSEPGSKLRHQREILQSTCAKELVQAFAVSLKGIITAEGPKVKVDVAQEPLRLLLIFNREVGALKQALTDFSPSQPIASPGQIHFDSGCLDQTYVSGGKQGQKIQWFPLSEKTLGQIAKIYDRLGVFSSEFQSSERAADIEPGEILDTASGDAGDNTCGDDEESSSAPLSQSARPPAYPDPIGALGNGQPPHRLSSLSGLLALTEPSDTPITSGFDAGRSLTAIQIVATSPTKTPFIQKSDSSFRPEAETRNDTDDMPFIAPRGSDRVHLIQLTPTERGKQLRYFGLTREDDIVHCLTCGRLGHMPETCPTRRCDACGKMDQHFTEGCPTAKKCTKCRDRGHSQESCPQKLKLPTNDVQCERCGSIGHGEELCQWMWKTYEPQNMESLKKVSTLRFSCYFCGSGVHWGDDCPYRTGMTMNSTTFSQAHAGLYLDPALSVTDSSRNQLNASESTYGGVSMAGILGLVDDEIMTEARLHDDHSRIKNLASERSHDSFSGPMDIQSRGDHAGNGPRTRFGYANDRYYRN